MTAPARLRVLVHDNSGHPFQAQLSRALAARGHDVVHSHCEAYLSGKGRLTSSDGDVRFVAIGAGRTVRKYRFLRRLAQELSFGAELARVIARSRPDVVLISNAPVPTLSVAVAWLTVRRTPWVLWHQDVYAAALGSLAGQRGSLGLRVAARLVEASERWCARRASHIVVIAESFRAVHTRWGTARKTTVIPNWAPLDEIVPCNRRNAWSAEHGLDETPTLLYSGTLGLKHNPALLVALAAGVRELGVEVRLVVVNEGPAGEPLRAEAAAHDVPMALLPFQPYDRLSEVLGSGDALVVLLKDDASVFSVPSKTLSYLCAGRPVLGMMPTANPAAELVRLAGGTVVRPDAASIGVAARWVADVLSDPARMRELGSRARSLAEVEFGLDQTVSEFERLLVDAHNQQPRAGSPAHAAG